MSCPMPILALAGATILGVYTVAPLIPSWTYCVASLVLLVAWFLFVDADLTTWLTDRVSGIQQSQLEGKVVWILGASSGIGEELAKQMTHAGAQVIISARRKVELERVAKECKGENAPFVLPLDVLDFAAHEPALQTILKKFSQLDILVLNVGRTQRSLAEETPLQVTEEMMRLNFFSLVRTVEVTLPTFLKQGNGTFYVTSSVAGKVGGPCISSYNATKHAVQGYFDALRLELADRSIQVLLACPGPIATPIEKAAFCAEVGKELGSSKENLSKKMPVERCVRLMLTQLTNGIDESWISQCPVLLFTYLAQYAPAITKFVGKRTVGPARVAAYRSGGDVYSMKAFVGGASSGSSSKKE